MTKIVYQSDIFREGDLYVGICHTLNVSSFGVDPEEAVTSLHEAVEAFLETCNDMGTLEEVLHESGFSKQDDVWTTREPILSKKGEAVLR